MALIDAVSLMTRYPSPEGTDGRYRCCLLKVKMLFPAELLAANTCNLDAARIMWGYGVVIVYILSLFLFYIAHF